MRLAVEGYKSYQPTTQAPAMNSQKAMATSIFKNSPNQRKRTEFRAQTEPDDDFGKKYLVESPQSSRHSTS